MVLLSRRAPAITIKMSGIVRSNAALLMAGQYAGSRPLDFATIEVEIPPISRGSTTFTDGELSEFFNNEIVEVTGATKSGGTQLLHYGRVVSESVRIAPEGESLILHSRQDDYLFGFPLEKVWVGSRALDKSDFTVLFGDFRPVEIDGDLVFNPLQDGIETPNRSADLFETDKAHFFIDPLSIGPERVQEDRVQKDGKGVFSVSAFWRLADAVAYLCWRLNPAQLHFKNPSLAELLVVLGDDYNQLRNHDIRIGTYLPQALDGLLRPHGFSWSVELVEGARKIVVFEKGGKKPPRRLKLQSFGDSLDTTLTNLERLDVTFDASAQSFNSISMLGGPHERELSVILRPCWDDQYDTEVDITKFHRGSDDFESSVEVQKAWRKFAANESGRYTAERDWWEEALDLAPYFELDATILRRRKLEPTISQDADGAPLGRVQGIYLEWWDPDAGSEGEWKPVYEHLDNAENFQILEDEMAIWFSGKDIPHQLRAIANRHGIDKVALRATATIRGDTRIRGNVSEAASFLRDQKKEIIDVADQYHRRVVDESEPADLENPVGGSVLAGMDITGAIEGTIDSRPDLQAEAAELIGRYNVATFDGRAVIEGIDWDFGSAIGQTISGIDGRNFWFNVAPLGKQPRYPTVMGVEFDVQEQKTTLVLDSELDSQEKGATPILDASLKKTPRKKSKSRL